MWCETAEENELAYAEQYFATDRNKDFQWGLIRGGMSSVAKLFMVQMQDYLGLGEGCRMNTPGWLP
ncbi:MAG: 4-alpha-glucanotransferase [Lachnospiraceae bacterium]|nr:4-alpha-glucanotransferase [Lachnospiraceae bacterium]MBR1853218.1 4-alpha-glucanotransferase [Lachnospiraceae bacterium]